MVNDSITYKKASRFTKFFWNACGAEIAVLENCGNNDRVKYFCLGGIVLATGLMAGFAGGYAFYTIFQPKDYALSDNTHMLTFILACIFGVLWGSMIYNLDRYIVASSGIGDGTEKITWGEFSRSLPRLVMGMIIAITISKPVEIRIFKTEIDNALYKEQLAEKSKFRKEVNDRSSRRRKQLDDEMSIYNKRIDQYNSQIAAKTEAAETERLQRGGRGTETNRLENEAKNLKAERNDFIANNANRIQNVRNQLEQINKDVQLEISKGDQVASQLDGLLQRIKLAHEIAGWPIIIFITLLFMVIELTPIFFKMMVNKSNYDIMLDEYKKNMLILSGLVPDEMNLTSKNVLREESIRQLEQKVALQKVFFDKLYENYKADLLKKVDEDYKAYVAEKDIKVDMMPGFDNHKNNDATPATENNEESKVNEESAKQNAEKQDKEPPIEEPLKSEDASVKDNTQEKTSLKEETNIVQSESNDVENDVQDNTFTDKKEKNETKTEDTNLDYTGPDFEEK